MESAKDKHHFENTQQRHINDGWLQPFSLATTKASTVTNEAASRSSALHLRVIVTLITFSLCLLLTVSTVVYKSIHGHIYTNELIQLHESNLSLINTLKPLSSRLENIRLLATANTNHKQAYSIINTELGQLIPLKESISQTDLQNATNSQFDQRLLDEVIIMGNTFAPLLHGYFQYHDREYLWAANTVPGTPYTLIHSTSHKHASLMSLLQNTNTLTTTFIAGIFLLLLWTSAIPSRLHKLSVQKNPVRQASADRTQQQHVEVEKQLLVEDLRDAIINNKLELYYQPKLGLKNNTIAGVEALARWTHPRHGFIPPNTFIQVAEQYALIRELTLWVLQTAIEQCAQWNRAGNNIGIAINLSPQNLHDENLAEEINALLQRWQVTPGQISLEISETVILNNPEQAISFFRRTDHLGICLSIDNFGIQHSSLSHLRLLPVKEIKIDKSFILEMRSNMKIASRVQDTIALGQKYGFTVVAEGVEEQTSLEQLQQMGCDSLQGYYICRPMPGRDLLPMMNACHAGHGAIMNSAETVWDRHLA